MSVSFIEIYSRAMTQLKSPILSRLQNNDLQDFCIIMNQYLSTALTFYNPNKETATRLSLQTQPSFDSESFIGDGNETSFTITPTEVEISDDSIIKVTVNDDIVNDYCFDSENSTITFKTAPEVNSQIVINWYNDGSFDGPITNEDITLLSLALCWAWAIQTENNQLDIDRSLNDSGDFKQHAEGTTQNAKVNWVKFYEEMYKRELSKADWRPLFRRF